MTRPLRRVLARLLRWWFRPSPERPDNDTAVRARVAANRRT